MTLSKSDRLRLGQIVRLYQQPVSVGLVLLVVLVVWNIQERARSRDLGLREVSQAAHGVADTVEASIQALVRRGHLNVPQVQIILDSVVASTEVTFVTLRSEDNLHVDVGTVPENLRADDEHGGALRGGQYLHWETIRLQDSTLPYRHRYPNFETDNPARGDIDLDDRPQTLILGLLADGYYRHVGEAAKRLNTILAVGVLCIVGLSLAWTLSNRNRALGARLGAARLRADYLEDLEHTAHGLAHETKNPLGLVRGLAQRISRDESLPDSARNTAAAIMEQADTATARLGEFLAYARPRQLRAQAVAGLALSRRVCSLLEPDFSEAEVALACEGQELQLMTDPEQFEQVLVNLLLNSLRASPTGTRVTVTLKREGSHGRLTVADQGAGIDPGLRKDIFKPYVTGRSDGHGLGLAIVKRIIESHGWSIELDSPAEPQGNGGTTVTISRMALADEGHKREEAE